MLRAGAGGSVELSGRCIERTLASTTARSFASNVSWKDHTAARSPAAIAAIKGSRGSSGLVMLSPR